MFVDYPAEPRADRRRVGHYRLDELIGRGGMGEVYRAFDERLLRWVAIKHIPDQKAHDVVARELLRREARTVARLNHPAIVQIHDIFEQDGGDWVVMELVEGHSVRRILRSGSMPLGQILLIAIEVIEGLAEAHGKGIVHRDLKTENVMLTDSGHAKILDFGLAKGLLVSKDETLATEGEIVGTGRAMSPEQILGHGADHRSDLFSFGSFLYEMCTGESPFLGATLTGTLARVCGEAHRPVIELRPEVPSALSELVDRLLEKDADERPQAASEVAQELRQLAAVPQPTPPQVDDDSSAATTGNGVPSNGVWWTLGLALALLIAAWATRGLWLDRTSDGSMTVLDSGRPRVAVLGFYDLGGPVVDGAVEDGAASGHAWVGTAFRDMVMGHLRLGDSLHLTDGERMAEIALRGRAFVPEGVLIGESPPSAATPVEPLVMDTLMAVGKELSADLVLFGFYRVEASATHRPEIYHLDVTLRDLHRERTLGSWSYSGGESDLAPMAAEAGTQVHAALGVGKRHPTDRDSL